VNKLDPNTLDPSNLTTGPGHTPPQAAHAPDIPEAKVPCPQCGSTHYEARVDNDIDTYNASVLGMAGLSFFGPTAGVVGALIGGTPSGKTYFFCLDCGCKFVKERK
jgi:hypothetical protein